MTTNHFIALLKTFLFTFMTGIVFMLIATFLYSNSMHDIGIEMVVGFFASFITSIMMSALWLPAITLIDKQRMNTMDAIALFSRHLPIVTVPFIITFIVMYLTDSVPTELAVIVVEIMFTAYASLYIYFRILKSKGFNRDENPATNNNENYPQ